MKILKKKIVIVSRIALIFSALTISFRIVANPRYEMTVNDIQGSFMGGTLFGPRGPDVFVVKFNEDVENIGEPHFSKSRNYWPLYLANDHCRIYGYKGTKHKKIKRKKYVVTVVDKPSYYSSGKLLLQVGHNYARLRNLWIEVSNIERLTPTIEIEELCDNVFTITTL